MPQQLQPIKGYPGSKSNNGIYQAIINLIPPITTYIEPFVGGGHIVSRLMPPAHVVINDISPDVYNYWRRYQSQQITVTNLNYRSCVDRYNSGDADTLIYMDPPYPLISRRQKQPLYKHEFTSRDHAEFLDYILQLKCKWIVSSYPNEQYDHALMHCRQKTLQVITRAGIATEKLYYNYPSPVALHDYRYLGKNNTDRQRIKRKAYRMQSKIASLQAVERTAILSQLYNTYFNI